MGGCVVKLDKEIRKINARKKNCQATFFFGKEVLTPAMLLKKICFGYHRGKDN